MRIYPAPGRLTRDPTTREPVPAEGQDVSDFDLYWRKALDDGDVLDTPPAEPTTRPLDEARDARVDETLSPPANAADAASKKVK